MLFYDAIKSQMTSFFTQESASLIAFIKFCYSSSSTLIAEFYIALKSFLNYNCWTMSNYHMWHTILLKYKLQIAGFEKADEEAKPSH